MKEIQLFSDTMSNTIYQLSGQGDQARGAHAPSRVKRDALVSFLGSFSLDFVCELSQ